MTRQQWPPQMASQPCRSRKRAGEAGEPGRTPAELCAPGRGVAPVEAGEAHCSKGLGTLAWPGRGTAGARKPQGACQRLCRAPGVTSPTFDPSCEKPNETFCLRTSVQINRVATAQDCCTLACAAHVAAATTIWELPASPGRQDFVTSCFLGTQCRKRVGPAASYSGPGLDGALYP